MHERAKSHANKYQRASRHAYLAFERDRFLAADEGQAAVFGRRGTAFDADDIRIAALNERLAGLLAAAAL